MGRTCPEGQYWDALVKLCVDCQRVCLQEHASVRCSSVCEAARCRTLPGHYYDRLLKRCMECAELCGRHPAECSQHCHISSPPGGLAAPGASATLIYSLLAVATLLLLSSLALALAAFLRGGKAKSLKPGPTGDKRTYEVQPGRALGAKGSLVGSASRAAGRESAERANPTETCVCVHCFPELKPRGQAAGAPPREPPFYQPGVLHSRAQIQQEGLLWTEPGLQIHGLKVQEEATVG
ncbi:uncharacterized protein tnfrsf13b [Pholidichthys leucotaenia]